MINIINFINNVQIVTSNSSGYEAIFNGMQHGMFNMII